MQNAVKKLATTALLWGLVAQTTWASDVILRFSWWGGGERHEATLKAIKAFEAQNPGVSIKGEYAGFNRYFDKLAVQLAGRMEPDIMQVNWAWVSQFSKDGNGFYDLNQSHQIKLADFIDESWKTGMVHGKLNALPVSYTARIFLWNKSTWNRAGLPLPKTWNDLLAAGKLFEQRLGKDYYPLDGHLDNSLMLAQLYMQQKTGKPWLHPTQARVAYSQEEALEWVQFYKRLVAEHVVMPFPLRLSVGGGNPETPTEQIPDWVSGKIAGMYQWDSTLKTRLSNPGKTMKFDIGDFLTLPDAKNTGRLGRPAQMLAVSKNSRNPEIAAKFVNWMLNSPEAAEILGSVRGASLSKPFREVQLKANKFMPLEIKALKQIESGKMDTPSPRTEHVRVLSWANEVFGQVAYGKISDQEAARMLVDETNSMLRRLK